VVDGVLGVVDVLVHDVRSAARVPAVAQPDLPDGAVLAEDVVHLLAGDVERQVPHVQHPVHLRRQTRVTAPAQARRRHCCVRFLPSAPSSRVWGWLGFSDLGGDLLAARGRRALDSSLPYWRWGRSLACRLGGAGH
jgi:hypothetical protein